MSALTPKAEMRVIPHFINKKAALPAALCIHLIVCSGGRLRLALPAPAEQT
jgi:hypothetical protein